MNRFNVAAHWAPARASPVEINTNADAATDFGTVNSNSSTRITIGAARIS